jgi:hypothetical protein
MLFDMGFNAILIVMLPLSVIGLAAVTAYGWTVYQLNR